MGFKKFLVSILATAGFASLKNKNGEDVALESAIEGLPETNYEIDEAQVKALAIEANKSNIDAVQTSQKQSDTKLADIEKRIEAAEQANKELSTKLTETETLAKALQDEIAAMKGQTTPNAKNSDGNVDGLQVGKSGEEEFQVNENHPSVVMANNWLNSGAITKDRYNKLMEEHIAKEKKKKSAK